MKKFPTKPVRAVGAALLLAAGLTAGTITGASAATSTMGCAGFTAHIVNGNLGNGNSMARTVDPNNKCATISHAAWTNQHGKIVQTPRGGYSTAETVTRTFYGVMDRSRHYHNGNAYTTLWHW